jgi:hypothetical protein
MFHGESYYVLPSIDWVFVVLSSHTRMGYQLWVLWLLLSWVSSIGKVFKFGDCFAVRMIMCFGRMYNDDLIEFLYYWLYEHECYFANYLRLLVLSRLWILFPFISFLFYNAIDHENHMMMLNTTFIVEAWKLRNAFCALTVCLLLHHMPSRFYFFFFFLFLYTSQLLEFHILFSWFL